MQQTAHKTNKPTSAHRCQKVYCRRDMKLLRLFAAILLVLYIVPGAMAQGALSGADLRNVDVDRISDADIKIYYERAVQSGLSENQLLELASTRGLSEQQVAKLRLRLSSLALDSGSKSGSSMEGSNTSNGNSGGGSTADAVKRFDEKLGRVSMEEATYNKRIFGSELFAATSTTFEPNLRIATPANYILGPDDELIINVYGFSEKSYKQKVNAEGNIYIDNVGPILVSGLSFEQAEAKIRAKLAGTIYKAMNSGSTKMQMRLGEIRSMRVTVLGEAKKPGTYTISSLTTLFNVLYLCGGPSDNGSYRNIELIRNNVVIRRIDLYKFLTAGDGTDNLLLQEQDIIRIPYYEARMVIEGYVKRPGIYEIKAGESFDKLFSYAGRFADSAYKKSITIYQLDDTRRRIKDLSVADFTSYYPATADSAVVGSVLMRYANRIRIRGAVMRPGDFELTDGMQLKQLIDKAGGLREDAYLGAGNILRLGKDLAPENVTFSLSAILDDKEKVILHRDDEVVINSIFDLQDELTVNIEGEVHTPGTYKWRKDFTVRDLILVAGGATEAAQANPKLVIEVSRRVRNADVTGIDFKQSEIIRIQTNKDLSNGESLLKLEPFDMVVVRPQPGYQQQRSVNISGPVMFPGRYYLEKNGERISDVIRRAGGFQAIADSNSVFIRRFKMDGLDMSERLELIGKLTNMSPDSVAKSPKLQQEFDKSYSSLSVNLGKALANPGSNDDLILENGDVIMVSQNSSLVKVSGAIYFPTMIPYEPGTNMRYYIKRTGDFTSQARRNQAFVIYPDGKAQGVKRFIFFKSYPKVTPRSEVFVPAKNDKARQGLSTGEWVAISSIFATLGTLLISVVR